MTSRWLKDAFAKFDVDHNGALSLTEVENLLHSLNIDVESKLLKMLFNVSESLSAGLMLLVQAPSAVPTGIQGVRKGRRQGSQGSGKAGVRKGRGQER